MSQGLFSADAQERVTSPAAVSNPGAERTAETLRVPDYSVSGKGKLFRCTSFLIGYAVGFVVLFVYYKLFLLSLIGGLAVGIANIFMAEKSAVEKRKNALRTQFFELLEAMSVSMRAGNPAAKAIASAREDLSLTYRDDSDIIIETDMILGKFNNAVPLSEAFSDFAERSGLEDIASFASVYATIEGKSSRADEIVRETQQIISEKMQIEMEIDTLMTSAKSEAYIMLVMPLVILVIIGYAGAGFMDAIYTTSGGRVVATACLVILGVSFLLARKFSSIKL